MRLGQLSRKIAVKPAEIVSFLKETYKIELSSHPNSKVNDEYIDSIIAHFKSDEVNDLEVKEESSTQEKKEKSTEPVSEINSSELVEEKEEIDDLIPKVSETISKEDNEVESDSIKGEDITEEKSEEFYEEEADLNVVDGIIKAPKVEVEGIKVVGKIELPEKPMDEPEELETENPDVISEESESSDKSEVKQYKEPSPKKKTLQKKKGKRKTITYEEQKEREQLIYEKKREAAEKKRKEQKRLNYEKLMEQKAAKTRVSSKKKAKKKSQNKTTIETNKPEPKTLWGKFLRWLNT